MYPQLAKQRASICWLISKACDDEVPLEYQEPFYKDRQGEDRLKPVIVQSLASAELYCLVLANVYADPNYNTLSHNGILQVLIRKGIYVSEPNDTSLTESVLIQDSPIKMSAHMVVIEALMSLYIKEVLIPEKVAQVVDRFSPLEEEEELPEEPEDAALFWINKSCLKLMERISDEIANATPTDEQNDDMIPNMSAVEYLWDLSDGKSLASLICLYSPTEFSWREICYNEPMTPADCIYNLQMVQLFCSQKLPVDIFFLTAEDFFECHRVIRLNILAFIADLLYHFEIKPAPCILKPTNDPIPNTSSEEYDQPSPSSSSLSLNSSFNGSRHKSQIMASVMTPAGVEALRGENWETTSNRSAAITSRKSSFPRTPLSASVKPSSAGSSRRRPSSASRSYMSSNAHRGYEDDEEEDEELTRYFSALDFDPDFDSPPEIVMSGKGGPVSLNPALNFHQTPRKGLLTLVNRRRHDLMDSNGFEETKSRSGRSQRAPDESFGHDVEDAMDVGSVRQVRGTNGSRSATYNKYNMQQPMHQRRDRRSDESHLPNHQNQSIYDKPRFTNINRSIQDLPAAGLLRRSNSSSQTYSALPKSSRDSLSHPASHGPPPRHGSSMADLRSARTYYQGYPEQHQRQGYNSVRRNYKPIDTFGRDPRHQMGYHGDDRRFSDEHSPDRHFQGQRQRLWNPEHDHPPQVEHPGMIRRSNSTKTVDGVRRGRRSSGNEYEASPGYHEELINDHQRTMSGHGMRRGVHNVSNQMMGPIDTHIESQTYASDEDERRRWEMEEEDRASNFRRSAHDIARQEHFVNRRRNSREDTLMERSYEGHDEIQNNGNRRNTWFVTNEQQNQEPSSLHHQKKDQRPNSLFIPWDEENKDRSPGVKNNQLRKPSLSSELKKSPSRHEVDSVPQRNQMSSQEQKQDMNNSQRPSLSPVKVPEGGDGTTRESPRPTTPGVGFVIGKDASTIDPMSELSMAKKKELIMNQSLKRKAELEAKRIQKEEELAKKREEEGRKREEQEKKREEDKQRKQRILEEYKLKKLAEDEEKMGNGSANYGSLMSKESNRSGTATVVLNRSRMRPASAGMGPKPRPKSLHVNSSFMKDFSALDQKTSRVTDSTDAASSVSPRVKPMNATTESLVGAFGNSTGSSLRSQSALSASSQHISSTPSTASSTSHLQQPQFLMPSMPPLFRRGPPSEAGSDIGSTFSEYNGPKLFVKPTQKTNRIIIINAINSVLAGAVNAEMKKRCLEEVNKSDSKHFLILFRGAGLQFRAIYNYCLDREIAMKLHGTGPRNIVNDMIDKYYKFNSGSKKFVPIQTKHLSITIDAVAIHNHLWPAPKGPQPRPESSTTFQ